jgi:hypothetical protein
VSDIWWHSDVYAIARNIADRRDNRGNERRRIAYQLGETVRLRGGKTVTIRGFKTFTQTPDLPPWPFYFEAGEEWAFNPDWIEASCALSSIDTEQLPLFSGAVW